MITQIMFEIPSIYAPGVKSGELVRFGTVLKNVATGRIVTHLQESGLAHSLIGKAMLVSTNPVMLAVSEAANAATGIYTAVQVNQIKAMVAGLQALQIATLGVSLVGVGVSVAGFIYMRKRFNALDSKIEALINTVSVGFEDQRKAMLRSHLSQVKGLMQQANQAPTLSKPEHEYSRIAESLAEQAAHFEGELEFVMKVSGKINPELFWQLAQALMVCNGVRIDCRMRTNELHNALTVSEDVAQGYQRLFGRLTPISFDAQIEECSSTLNVLKDITDAAATKPYLIDYLRSQQIDGRSYMNQLEDETERPLLMLKVS